MNESFRVTGIWVNQRRGYVIVALDRPLVRGDTVCLQIDDFEIEMRLVGSTVHDAPAVRLRPIGDPSPILGRLQQLSKRPSISGFLWTT